MAKVYRPNRLNSDIRAMLPTPAHFAVYALNQQAYIFVHFTDIDANPAEVYCGETFMGLWGYEGDRVYVEDAPGQDVLSNALLRTR
jgi:hypothetical protein